MTATAPTGPYFTWPLGIHLSIGINLDVESCQSDIINRAVAVGSYSGGSVAARNISVLEPNPLGSWPGAGERRRHSLPEFQYQLYLPGRGGRQSERLFGSDADNRTVGLRGREGWLLRPERPSPGGGHLFAQVLKLHPKFRRKLEVDAVYNYNQ